MLGKPGFVRPIAREFERRGLSDSIILAINSRTAMRILGRDYILKILNQEYLESVFDIRKKYFASGKPQELGKNSTIFFVMKNPQTLDYDLVGEAKPTFVGPLSVRDKDESDFSEEHNWRFVIELMDLWRYPKLIPAAAIFSIGITKKLHTQRPYGIQLSLEQGRLAKQKIDHFLKSSPQD